MDIRRIKFRAWSTSSGMISHETLKDHYFYSTLFTGKDWMVMQSTGLTDCDGQDIYEGDIVQLDWHDGTMQNQTVGEVCFRQNNASFIIDDKKRRDIEFFHSHVTRKVIGNVFENPELIPT